MKNNVALIGCGYWGKNYVKNLDDFDTVHLKYICDLVAPKGLSSKLLQGKLVSNYDVISTDKEVDSVIIATQTDTHYKIVKDMLLAGKNVLVEKPITADSEQASELIQIAKDNSRILMVGHVFRYNPAVNFIKNLIDTNVLGDLRYIEAKRVGLGPIRKDVSALWDLATHDIYIATYFVGGMPESVSYQGVSHNGSVDDIVVLNMKFPNKTLASIYVNWEHPIKERKIVVGGVNKAVLFDDIQLTEKIFVYDKGVDYQPVDADFGVFQASTRDGDIIIPKIPVKQPLMEQLKHFFNCVNGKEKCITDGEEGLGTVRILEAAELSKIKKGLEVRLNEI